MSEATKLAAMVLAAGKGTRLAPLTDALPKPLCPVGDRPQIDHVLAHLARSGFARVVVNTHHLHEHFTKEWAAAQPLEVVRVHEDEILGTGGGVANAKGALGEGPVLVWNADILAQPDVAALAAAHGGRAGWLLAIGALRPAGEGNVGLDEHGAIVRLRSFARGGEVRSADYTGVAILGDAARASLPANGCLFGDALVPALERGERVPTAALGSGFIDTGSLAEYLDANLAWLAGRGEASYAAPSARVAKGITLDRAIVGAGATVEGAGGLDEVVVWPGAKASAPLRRCIVTRDRVVPAGAARAV